MKAAETPIPSITECIAAGTHMIRCTADGACKVCFDRSDSDVTYSVSVVAAPKAMKVELKRFTTNARLSQETTAFAADVWVDGKKAGFAENDGHGGNTMVHMDKSVRDAFEAYGKTLVPAEYKCISGSEWIVDQMVEAEIKRREDAKFAKRLAAGDAKEKARMAAHGMGAARFRYNTRQGISWMWFALKPGADATVVAAEIAKKSKVVVDEVVSLAPAPALSTRRPSVGIPYVPITWVGKIPFVVCPHCNLNIKLVEKKDFESYSKVEYAAHLHEKHPDAVRVV